MSTNKKERGEVITYEFKHTLPVQIRFNDIDTLGHVNNTVYFSFFDLGKSKYFTEARKGEVDWEKVDIVVANINCNFLAPIFFNENIAVQTQVNYIHEKSFKITQQLINLDTAEVKCSCATIMVGFDVENCVAIPISNEWVECLSAFEGRNLKES